MSRTQIVCAHGDLSIVVQWGVWKEREAAGETARGESVEESAEMGERSVLGIAKGVAGGPAGAGCANALLAYYAVVVVLG